jgi:hypothetical protein
MNPLRPMLTRRGLPAAALHGRDPVERKAGQGTHRYPPPSSCACCNRSGGNSPQVGRHPVCQVLSSM